MSMKLSRLVTYLSRRHQPHAKTVQPEPVAFTQGIGLGGFGYVSQVTDDSYVYAYAVNPWVYACVHAIATAVATVPFEVERSYRGEWTRDVGAAPLKNLLEHVNADDSTYTLFEGTAASLALHGNAFWLLLRARDGQAPTSIQLLPPNSVTPVAGRGKRSSIIKGYRVKLGNGGTRDFDDVDIVHFKFFSPTDQLLGQPPTRAAEVSINAWNYAAEFNKEFMRRGGLPAGIFKTEQVLDKTQEAALRGQWEEWRARGGANRPLVLSASVEFEAVGVSPDQVLALDYPARLREEICACYGVPPAVVGIYEYANYANAELQRKLFWSDTVSDYLPRIAGAINEQLAWQFDGGPWRVVPDTSSIASLQVDVNLQAQRMREDVKAGVITINDMRRIVYGLDPVPWGDEWWGSVTTVPLAPSGSAGTAAAAQKTTVERHAPTPGPVLHVKAPRRAPDARARTFSKLINMHRETFAAQMQAETAAWYDSLAQEMLQKLDEQNLPAARVKDPRLTVLIFSLATATEDLRARLIPLITACAKTVGDDVLETLGVGFKFDMSTTRMQELVRGRTYKMKTVTEDAYRRVYESLAEGLAQSENIEQLRERVLEFARQGKEHYAETVARTESGIAANEASRETYVQAGATHIEWVAMLDNRTRPTHAEVSGTVIALGEQFNVGGYACNGPGDPALPAEEVCNCRCVTAPVLKDEKES